MAQWPSLLLRTAAGTFCSGEAGVNVRTFLNGGAERGMNEVARCRVKIA